MPNKAEILRPFAENSRMWGCIGYSMKPSPPRKKQKFLYTVLCMLAYLETEGRKQNCAKKDLFIIQVIEGF